MKIIICEKPNLAVNVAKSIGLLEKKDGYFTCNKNFIVTFAFGHLLELKDIKDYKDFMEYIKWKDITSPFYPPEFEYKIKAECNKQIKIIKSLIKENKPESIIHCGDADREGQLIIDNLLNHIGYSGKVERLWLPEQTPATILNQLNNLKDNSEYINLFKEGQARTYMDWLLGINLTVFLTNKSGILLRAGRVLIPIVKFIYDRDLEIKNFIPTKYFSLDNEKTVKLSYKDKFSLEEKEKAIETMNRLNSSKAKVIKLETKEIKKYPGKLFSLDTLQSKLSKDFGITFEKSMKCIQELYEKGYLTYPRTNTEYLSLKEQEKVKTIIKNLQEQYGFNDLEFKDSEKIFDDSKIESHSAITPTYNLPHLASLSELEKTIYTTVLNRFAANFYNSDTIINETKMIISIADTEFEIKGQMIKDTGFYKYESTKIENNLPTLKENDEFEIEFKLVEKETQKPKHITESSLSNFLKNPLKKEEIDEQLEQVQDKEMDIEDYKNILQGLEIGTVATRTGIIQNAITNEYITRKKSNFLITDKGIFLIELLNKFNINLYTERSIEFSRLLKKIYLNENTLQDLLLDIHSELDKIFATDIEIKKVNNKVSLGKCPKCNGDIYKGKTKSGKINYYCSNYKNCNFTFWEQSKFFKDEFKLTEKNVTELLEKNKTSVKLQGKKQNIKYVLKEVNGKEYVNFEILK